MDAREGGEVAPLREERGFGRWWVHWVHKNGLMQLGRAVHALTSALVRRFTFCSS